MHSTDADPLAWTRDYSPVLTALADEYAETEPLDGYAVAVCSSVTTNTGVFVETLAAAGADRILVTAAGPTYNDPAVIEALAAHERVETFVDPETDQDALDRAYDDLLAEEPDVVFDDGCVLTARVHAEFPNVAETIVGGTEQTTVGITRLRAMEREGVLQYPVYGVNDTPMKHYFDNVHGTGESTLAALSNATNTMLAGKTAVVAGYGYCGKGIARKLRAIGAHTVVTEVDARRAMVAHVEGHRTATMAEAAGEGDLFVAATGSVDVLTTEHFECMADGAILASAGTAAEIDVDGLADLAVDTTDPRAGITTYHLADGRRIHLLADGYVVNLAAPGAAGHPAEVIDTTFAMKVVAGCDLIARDPADAPDEALDPGLHDVPDPLDRKVAHVAADAMGVAVDEPTDRQREYADDWVHAGDRK